jgi:hypothetical protein
MAVSVKDASAAAQKFVTRAQAAGTDYANGVANSGNKWSQNTAASAQTWAQGVSQAAANGQFQKGINSTSQQKFTNRVSTVGSQRYGTGVANSAGAWQTGVTPYLQTIAGLTLPARQPKGSPANYQRVQAVGDALRAKKLGMNS